MVFIAVVKTGVAVGTIIGIGSAPIAGGLLGLAFRGETLSRRWIMATFIAIAGCTLLSLSGGSSHSQINLIGIILAIGAGASYAAYTLTIKSLLDRFTPDQVIAVTFILGAILLTPLIAAKDMSWLLQMRSIMIVLHLGLVTAAIAYCLFAQGLKTATVATATTLSLAEPLTAGMLGVIVLGEKLKALSALGICLMILGLVILALGGQKSLRTTQ